MRFTLVFAGLGVAQASGCGPKPTPVLFPQDFPRVEEELDDVDVLDPLPDDVRKVVGLKSGETAPGDGILVPPVRWAKVRAVEGVEPVLRRGLDECYAGRTFDRAVAQEHSDRVVGALRTADSEARSLRAAVIPAALLGGLVGAGVAVGVAWAYPR